MITTNQSPASSAQAIYNFWLGLIPQFFAQLGAPAGGTSTPPPVTPGLAFPLDQVARAATMTQDALKKMAGVYAPMLQAAGAPGMLAQWASANPFLSGANPFLGGGVTPAAAPPQPGAQAAINPFARMAPWMTGIPPATGLAGNVGATAPGTFGFGAMPMQALQRTWIDFGSQLAGSLAQIDNTAFERTFGALSDALGFGPMRKLQAAYQDLLAVSIAQNEARANYAMLVQNAFASGFERLLSRLADMAGRGERVDSVIALLRMWAVCTEEAVHEVLQSEPGLAATAAMSRAGITYRKKLKHMAGIVADTLDMATRRDLDEAFREIQELKRQLRATQTSAKRAKPARGDA